MKRTLWIVLLALAAPAAALAGVGDPQCRTDHPWYPGELSCSTWERLFATQAALYKRVTGRAVDNDEDKALASWYWRNLNYFHCTDAPQDIWDQGPGKGLELRLREYWTGLFAHGYGLCGTTHAQWIAEMDRLLGPARGRTAGVSGHTSFEVYLTGGAYGEGRWALLDHDISTVIFTPDGKRLMGIPEISRDLAALRAAKFSGGADRGWLVSGLSGGDVGVYASYSHVEAAAGYAGPPPMVYLRSGESLRRYLDPGLEDGRTLAYWGINYARGGILGPSRSLTWVNQPEKMFRATRTSPARTGQARFANAVYTYRPDFAGGKYKEGLLDESDRHVTFEWYSPYIIAATPAPAAAKEQWGIYKPGCTGGLTITGKIDCPVDISTDQGATWQKVAPSGEVLDATDLVKGHRQYLLRLGAGAKALAASGLTIRTVCQCAPTVIPRLGDGANRVSFAAGGTAVISAGPNCDQAAAHLVAGKIGESSKSSTATLELAAPRAARAVRLHAASRHRSGCPPRDCLYNIDCSTDAGKTWRPVVKDFKVLYLGPPPKDWWSQSYCYGELPLDDVAGNVRVRFTNDGGVPLQLVEAHLIYKVENSSPLRVTFAWTESGGKEAKTASHTYPAGTPADEAWTIQTGPDTRTRWVEYAAE